MFCDISELKNVRYPMAWYFYKKWTRHILRKKAFMFWKKVIRYRRKSFVFFVNVEFPLHLKTFIKHMLRPQIHSSAISKDIFLSDTILWKYCHYRIKMFRCTRECFQAKTSHCLIAMNVSLKHLSSYILQNLWSQFFLDMTPSSLWKMKHSFLLKTKLSNLGKVMMSHDTGEKYIFVLSEKSSLRT